MPDLTGHELGRYHLLEKLGEGGMATVYKGYDTRLEREVAVKFIRREAFSPEILDRVLKRFEREAKMLARLTHPNIVSIIDFGDHEGSPYLVMPFFSGGTLKQHLGKPMQWQKAVKLLLPIANALEYAHGLEVVHRDVKPANILITASGEPMLTDFGIAKMLDLQGGQTLTGTGVGVGTPEYMAPEQGMGQEIDGRADIYALGIVLFELLTGRKPYIADTPMAVVFKHMTDPLPRISELVEGLPGEIELTLIKSLAKLPQDRFLKMGDFYQSMEKLLHVNFNDSKPIPPEISSLPDEDSEATIDQPIMNPPSTLQSPNVGGEIIAIVVGENIIMEFVHVPAGKFLMGSDPKFDPNAEEDEIPQHEVFVPEFWIGLTPVTNEEYEQYYLDSEIPAPENWKGGLPRIGTDMNPVTHISYSQAENYCKWLSDKSGRNIRLPSEIEWEKAARGTEGVIYPWGNDDATNKLARFNIIFGKTCNVLDHEVGASIYGALDMAGNVWEWTSSKYLPHSEENSASFENDSGFVVRGGSFKSSDYMIRCAYRNSSEDENGWDDIGFRCAMDAI